MDGPKLTIIDSKNLNISKRYTKEYGWQWSFMGVDPCLREKINNLLGNENRHCYAKELQDVCIEHKQAFLNWIEDVGKRQNNITWWATQIAYKSPYTSDIFLNYCFLALIQRWVKQGVEKRIIIAENPWLIRACLINFNNGYLHILKSNKYFVENWIKQHLIAYKIAISFLFLSIKMWILNKTYAFRYHKQVKNILKNKIDILSCTWIEDRSFKGQDGCFCDPYLGVLKDYYSKMGLKTIVITLPIFPRHLLKKVYQCKEIIPSIYFAKLSDIVKSFFWSIFLILNDEIADCNGLDLKPIFKYEKIQEKGRICYTFLHYLVMSNIFKKQNISCKALIYPFENQPWDRMMIIALRKWQSKPKIIACHNIGVPFFYLNFFLGKNENKFHPQPDVIMSNGEYWGSVLRKAGFSCLIKNGGSLRFSSAFKPEKLDIQRSANTCKDNILVLLSNSLNYSLDLLFYLLRSSQNNKNFFIKPHPDITEETIRKHIGKLPNNFIFVSGLMNEWLGKVGWAIHIGTNAAIECMIKGIPVFKYLPERIDLDPLLSTNFKQRVVTDNEVLNFNNEEIFEMPGTNLIAEPFNEIAWNDVLG